MIQPWHNWCDECLSVSSSSQPRNLSLPWEDQRFGSTWHSSICNFSGWLTFQPSTHYHHQQTSFTMYCLQWMLPILLVPKSACAMVVQDQMIVIFLYMLAFFIERRPCVLCVLVFIVAVVVLCASGIGQTLLCEWSPSMFFSSMCSIEGHHWYAWLFWSSN